jgi:hypothetical protein
MTTIRHPSAPQARLLLEARENAHAPLGGLAPLRWSKEASILFMDDAGIDLAVVLLEEDEFITKEAQPAIKAALPGKPNVEMYIYISRVQSCFRTPHRYALQRPRGCQGERVLVGLSFVPPKNDSPMNAAKLQRAEV